MRFPGKLKPDLRKVQTLPRTHGARIYAANVRRQKMMCADDPRHGRQWTTSPQVLGRMSTKEVDEQRLNAQNKNLSCFVEGVASNTKSAVCDIRTTRLKMAVAFTGNTTAILSRSSMSTPWALHSPSSRFASSTPSGSSFEVPEWLWSGRCVLGIHYPPARDLAGGLSPNARPTLWATTGVVSLGKCCPQAQRHTTPHSLDIVILHKKNNIPKRPCFLWHKKVHYS